MGDGRPILAVVRKSEMDEPPVPSVEDTCADCGCKVWVSQTMAPMRHAMKITCPPCITAFAQPRN